MVVILYFECVFLFIFDMLSQDESKKHFSEQFKGGLANLPQG
jgi:hypothetical protein